MKVLLVKLTSMGDLIHALPAITDAANVYPDIQFDWVVDEAFAEVATWHEHVHKIIKSAHRRWRKNLANFIFKGEMVRFIRDVRREKYDFIIDGQTNFKSALITRAGRGPRYGLDKDCAAESIAHLAYKHKIHVPKGGHAVERLRELFAKSLNYELPTTTADFAISREALRCPDVTLPKEYLIFIHNASWVTKLWPEAYWEQLIHQVTADGFSVVMPCGNDEEYARSCRLAKNNNKVYALPKIGLSEVAYVIAHAKAAVSVDTGLSHITGALETPAVNIYGSTDSGLIGAPGSKQIHLQADFSCAPCYLKECSYKEPSEQKPACYTKLPPDLIYKKLNEILMKKDFWHDRWENNNIGFHQANFNKHLIAEFPKYNLAKGATVFVPLCGKSLDMIWLYQQGYRVIGVEISELAAQQFFKENDIAFDKTTEDKFTCYKGDNIEIYCGDVFDFTNQHCGKIDAVYDRASVIALPPETRTNYAKHLMTLVTPDTHIFILTFVYDQSLMSGPPFSVPPPEIHRLFSAFASIKESHIGVTSNIPKKFNDAGIMECDEYIYDLRKL